MGFLVELARNFLEHLDFQLFFSAIIVYLTNRTNQHCYECKDLVQKSKVKWALEGDENTSFFQGSLNKKRRQLAIRGILQNGEWIEDPGVVKAEFLDHFRNRFQQPTSVWDCGGDRAPGPDGFAFKFFTSFWDLITYDVDRLSNVIGNCISLVQSAFIKGQFILDGPLILNEVLAWYRHRKKELIVFKVDFEKAFDSLRWDFLDLILDKFGFGSKWRA
ncbi:hypothetical protein Tco_1329461 [Tanacetum coccineum]